MVIDCERNEVAFTIVYWGVGLGGKATNLQHVWLRTPPDQRSELTSIATEAERMLSFSFAPRSLPPLRGRTIRFSLACVPGAVFYTRSREQLLAGVDGVVFVVDTQTERMASNVESLESLERTLAEREKRTLQEVPFVLQYKKRDLPNAAPRAVLDGVLNPRGAPSFEAVAVRGEGVFETLKGCAKLILERADVHPRLTR